MWVDDAVTADTTPRPATFAPATEPPRLVDEMWRDPQAVGFMPAGLAPVAGSAVAVPSGQETRPPRDFSAVFEEMVSRLLVSEGPSGTGQVRMELKGEGLSGVWLTMKEAQGQVQVDVVCATDAARMHLSELVRRGADGAARRCRRDLVIRVGTAGRDPQVLGEGDASIDEVLGRA